MVRNNMFGPNEACSSSWITQVFLGSFNRARHDERPFTSFIARHQYIEGIERHESSEVDWRVHANNLWISDIDDGQSYWISFFSFLFFPFFPFHLLLECEELSTKRRAPANDASTRLQRFSITFSTVPMH